MGAAMQWRWRTVADPHKPPKKSLELGHLAGRITHPLAGRVGHRCELLAQSSTNGNRLVRFDDGLTVVAPHYAVSPWRHGP